MCSLSVCENRDIFQIGKNKTSLQVEVVGDCKNHSVMALTGKKFMVPFKAVYLLLLIMNA